MAHALHMREYSILKRWEKVENSSRCQRNHMAHRHTGIAYGQRIQSNQMFMVDVDTEIERSAATNLDQIEFCVEPVENES